MTLLKRLFRRKAHPEVRTKLSFEEANPFFQANGVDVDVIPREDKVDSVFGGHYGFPLISKRDDSPTMAYVPVFHNLSAKRVVVDEKVDTIITGVYEVFARAAISPKQSGDGCWHPGESTFYDFKIESGRLNLWMK